MMLFVNLLIEIYLSFEHWFLGIVKYLSMKKIITIVLFLITLIACNKKETIPEEEFVKVYVDILVMQDTLQDKSIPPDSIRAIVLKQHNISDSIYANTINYYNESEERWGKFFDKAIKYVEEKKVAAKEK